MIVSRENDIQEVTSVLVSGHSNRAALALALLNIDVTEKGEEERAAQSCLEECDILCLAIKKDSVALYQPRHKMGLEV